MIQEFKNPLLSGKPCMIHEDFIPAMNLFCQYLKITGTSFLITSSFRTSAKVKGAIVDPSKISNHMIGCAIDGNVYDKQKKLWDSESMEVFAPESPKYNTKTTGEVLQLINLVRRSNTLRWGGDFRKPDVVHFDSALNINNPVRWKEIYNELHA